MSSTIGSIGGTTLTWPGAKPRRTEIVRTASAVARRRRGSNTTWKTTWCGNPRLDTNGSHDIFVFFHNFCKCHFISRLDLAHQLLFLHSHLPKTAVFLISLHFCWPSNPGFLSFGTSLFGRYKHLSCKYLDHILFYPFP